MMKILDEPSRSERKKIMSLYQEMIKAVPIDHHESDLYAKVTPKSREIMTRYGYRSIVKIFISQIDGAAWYDIPFAYEPFWEKKLRLNHAARKERNDI